MSTPSPTKTGSRPVLERVKTRRAEMGATLAELRRVLVATHELERSPAIGAALEHLREEFKDHVALTEGSGGLHQQVVADAPRLQGRVAALQRQHREIGRTIEEALRSLPIEARAPSGRLAVTIDGLLRKLARHRRRGADLVYEAYQVDLGEAGD